MHFQGKQLCHSYCCLPYKLGSSRKGKNLFPSEQIYSFKIRSNLVRLHSPGKQAQEVRLRILSPFEKVAEKDAGVPIHLKGRYY